MREHSCLDDAAHAVMIGREAPVFQEADYEAVLELLEDAHKRVRAVFIGGQERSVPVEWRMDGLVYREWDNKLVEAKTKLLQRYRASKFFAGSRRRDMAVAKAKKNIAEWQDLPGSKVIVGKDLAGNVHESTEHMGEAQAANMKRAGFDVRRIGIGKATRYQFATRKEV